VGTRLSTFTYDGAGRATSTERAGGVNRYEVSYGTPPGVSTQIQTDPTTGYSIRRQAAVAPQGTQVTGPNGQLGDVGAALVNGVAQVTSSSQPAGSGCAAEYDVNGVPLYETIYLNGYPVGVLKQAGSAANADVSVQLYNLYADHIATARMITRQDHAIVWRWDTAEAFGGTPAEENPSGLGVFTYHQRFPGQVFVAESGLLKNWHRDYNARRGRYMQSDPIGLYGGINTYAYVNGNPLSYTDPEGLFPWWAIGWGVANGLMTGYQRWLDPCASWGQIGRDVAGGFASGFIAGIVPITSMTAGRAILAGAAAGYGGSQASSLIGSGSMASSGAAMQLTLLGGLGGAAGNMSGLGAALANTRLGLPATNALFAGDRLGTGVGVRVSALDTASQFSPACRSNADRPLQRAGVATQW